MTEKKTHTGSCHCGKVRFETTADIGDVMACNCSICSRTGALLAFVPEEQFKILSGEDALSDYQFGKKHIHHLFCPTCGIRTFGRGSTPEGKEMFAVNVRCLEDIAVDSLKVTHFDGKSL